MIDTATLSVEPRQAHTYISGTETAAADLHHIMGPTLLDPGARSADVIPPVAGRRRSRRRTSGGSPVG